MREIVLTPGTSIEIDGVVVRAAKPQIRADVTAMYNPDTGMVEPLVGGKDKASPAINPEKIEVALSDDGKDLLKSAIASWLSMGDLEQAPLLTGAAREVAKLISTCEAESSRPCVAAASTPSSPLPADGTRE